MDPDAQKGGQPQASATPAQTSEEWQAQQAQQREAAANVIRGQIDTLYGTEQSAPAQTDASAHIHTAVPVPEAEQWKEYHSAWQNYYQKYYAAYYSQQVKQADVQQPGPNPYFKDAEPEPVAAEAISQDEALSDLRHQLLDRVQQSAKKVRRSRHFIPIISALGVIVIFAFLQYNSFITGTVMAYVSPGTVNVQNIVVDPNDTVAVTADPRLIIPKINVDVPVLYDVGSDYNSQMAAMQKGVAQFSIPGANAHPGEIGNTAIAGHSSNDLLDPGDYKFIFAQLEKLAVGDTIYANYNSVRYTYVVTKTAVVAPDNVAALQYSGDTPIMTLITCTPLGTSRNRLLVTAQQVSPDPSTAQKASSATTGSATTIPGANAPSIFQKLFGANG